MPKLLSNLSNILNYNHFYIYHIIRGVMIPLDVSCAVFITMNPGY